MKRIAVALLVAVVAGASVDARWLNYAVKAVEPTLDGQALLDAIRRDDTKRLRSLLRRGVNPDTRDQDGTPAVMLASLFGSPDALRLLLDGGANPNTTNAAGATALMWAVPDLRKVEILLGRGADVNARSTNLQRTALLVAAGYPSSVAVIEALLRRGADLRARDRAGMHAVGRAAASADLPVVRFLTERGADIDAAGFGGGRLQRYTTERLAATSYLISKGVRVDVEALTTASAWVPADVLERWIRSGADVNARVGSYRKTPLMVAVASEETSADTLALLLANAADPNAEDAEGERALDWAVYRDDRSKIAVLERHGATRGTGPRQRDRIVPAGSSEIRDPATAIAASVNLLLATARTASANRPCITCHSHALPLMVGAAARKKGLPIDASLTRSTRDDIVRVYSRGVDNAMQGDPLDPSNALAVGYVLMALAADGEPLTTTTAAFAHWLSATQLPDGHWPIASVSRPPMQGSVVTQTAIAVRGLMLYRPPGMSRRIDEQVRRARAWLTGARSLTAEDRGMRLLGLVWTGASRSAMRAAIEDVVRHQRADGGWSQLDHLQTDAYATGLSLVALHEAGIPPADGVYRRGVDFLRRTQQADGTWFVATRAYPIQAHFESGFPFGRHQWISAGATNWAALALIHALPAVK